MYGNFCVPLVMNKMFGTVLNFDVFNRSCKHDCTATLAIAAIAAPNNIGINIIQDGKF